MFESKASTRGVELTIAIPTYNRAESLKALLECLRRQDEIASVQVVVSDNGSTDATRAVAASFSVSMNVKITGFETNRGFDANYVNCVAHADGDYVWVMGDDDALVPAAVSRVLAVLRKNEPDVLVVNGGDYRGSALVPRVRYEVKTTDTRGALMSQLGWHLSWIGTSITKRSILRPELLQVGDHNAFVHLPLLLRGMPMNIRSVFLRDVLLHTTVNNSDYFRDPIQLVRTFGERLHDTLRGVDDSAEAAGWRDATVRGFHKHLSMFGWRSVIGYKKAATLGGIRYARHLKYFNRVNPYAVMLLPLFLLPTHALKTLSMLKRRRSSSARRQLP